ncbi:MAG: hypothetical protein ACOC2K_02835 [Bacteroidota bacterium]
MESIKNFLKEIELFKDLNDKELDLIVKMAVKEEYEEGRRTRPEEESGRRLQRERIS